MADNDDLTRLGQWFHDVRVGRGVTLKEAAGEWSPASLSRFERGQQDLAADKAVALIARLGIENSDFLTAYEAQPGNFPVMIFDYCLAHHDATIAQRRAAYVAAQSRQNAITDYVGVLFEAAEHWIDPAFHFTQAQEQILADRLAAPERYSTLEVVVLKLVVGPASHELRALLEARIARLAPSWSTRTLSLLIVWLGALMARDMPMVDRLQKQLAPAFADYQSNPLLAQFLSNWQYGLAAAAWLREPTAANAAAVQALVQDLQAMGNTGDGGWFANMFARMQNAHVVHQSGLVDHPQTLPVAHTPQAVLQNQRRALGVTIEALGGAQRTTALRRFEAGQTQVAFSALVAAMGMLGLFPSQVFTFIDRSAAHPMGAFGLWATYLKVAVLPKEQAQPVIDRFGLQVPGKPARILQTQRFILASACGVDETQLTQDARVILPQLLAADHWYTMELLAVQEILAWIDVDEALLVLTHGHRLLAKTPALDGLFGYFYAGIGRFLVRVVQGKTPTVCRQVLRELRWLVDTGQKASPEAWLAAGAWLIACDVAAPSAAHHEAVAQYLTRTRRVGHVEALAALRRDWDGVVAAGYFAE